MREKVIFIETKLLGHAKSILFSIVYILKQKQTKISRILNIFLLILYNFQNSTFERGKFLKIRSSINLPWGHVRSNKKMWAQSVQPFWRLMDNSKQTNKKQTKNKNIYRSSEITEKDVFILPAQNSVGWNLAIIWHSPQFS